MKMRKRSDEKKNREREKTNNTQTHACNFGSIASEAATTTTPPNTTIAKCLGPTQKRTVQTAFMPYIRQIGRVNSAFGLMHTRYMRF